jgi:hypothetical protein
MCLRIQQTPQHSHSLMKPICCGGIIVILVLALFACSNSHIRGEFQEDVPGGGQTIVKYEIQSGELKQIVQSTESTNHFIETTFLYARGELSSVCVLISEFVRNDNFDIIDAKEVATLKWVVSEQGLVLKEGLLNEQRVGENRDYLAESERMKGLVNKHRSGTL